MQVVRENTRVDAVYANTCVYGSRVRKITCVNVRGCARARARVCVCEGERGSLHPSAHRIIMLLEAHRRGVQQIEAQLLPPLEDAPSAFEVGLGHATVPTEPSNDTATPHLPRNNTAASYPL